MTLLKELQTKHDRKLISYRRVSTKGQERSEYKNQLVTLKAAIHGFNVSDDNVIDLKESISGLDSIEKRMASKLGKALRHLKRNPRMIMVVASADRISRRADVFVKIQEQGLGDRCIDVSTGKNVNQIVALGEHKSIELRTEAQGHARQEGKTRSIEAGGYGGRANIKADSKHANRKKSLKANIRDREVLSVVAELTILHRGTEPSMSEVCDVLDHREVRTGQGHFYTPKRLSQRKKLIPDRWKNAADSYRRPRRRIARYVRAAQSEIQKRRTTRWRRMRLDALFGSQYPSLDEVEPCRYQLSRCWPIVRQLIPWRQCDDGCRGPPDQFALLIAIQIPLGS